MRALEKKGFDATEVQNALTESMKKGKLEGLDKFGLSIKDLGSPTANLRTLVFTTAGIWWMTPCAQFARQSAKAWSSFAFH